jgi:hypothetical protein
MVILFKRLWAGDVLLARTFWEFAVMYGLALNVAASAAAMALLSAGQPGWLALAVYFLPAPYTAVALVAVWRSADRYAGRKLWADLARPAAVLWSVLLIV